MHPKAQHYVPQVYLRNFASKRKQEYFTCCFDKTTRKTFKPNIKNIANQTGFYDFVTNSGEKASIESFFNDVETKAGLAFLALNENPTISTLLENKDTLANFFALQESRTVVFRDVQNDIIRGANERLEADGFSFPIPTENETKEFQARFLIDMSDFFANALLKMKWILVFNKTPKPFWTSDNPIVRYNPHKSELVGNLGLESPGIQLHIPITPALAVIICDPFENAQINSELPAFSPSVDFNNSGQVIYSRQFLFSIDDNFDLVKDMIAENSELSNLNRPRITLVK
jgi:hypothetical protein